MNWLSSEMKSRRLAREMVKKIHPFIRPDQHVHHIDGNPFNNNISNLCVLPKGFHASLHKMGTKAPAESTTSKRALIRAEREIAAFNKLYSRVTTLKQALFFLEQELFFYNNNVY